MGAFLSATNTAGLDRVIIEDEEGGSFAFGFITSRPSIPEWDYWFQTKVEARQFCLVHWGVPLDTWAETDERHA